MVKILTALRETRVPSWGWEDLLEEGMAIHSSILAGRIPIRQRSLVGYSPWSHKESDMTEQLSTHITYPPWDSMRIYLSNINEASFKIH